MKVWHGTGDYALNGLLKNKPIKKARAYVSKPCFSTTLSFDIATLFAVRKTTATDFLKGVISGVVVEYELNGTEGKHFKRAVDPCLQNEQEVAVFSVDCLVPIAVWHHFNGKWNRGQLNEPFASKKNP
jgi:bacillopeptidase F (M6 metalloprotease family)